jgi:hypothetical protein
MCVKTLNQYMCVKTLNQYMCVKTLNQYMCVKPIDIESNEISISHSFLDIYKYIEKYNNSRVVRTCVITIHT